MNVHSDNRGGRRRAGERSPKTKPRGAGASPIPETGKATRPARKSSSATRVESRRRGRPLVDDKRRLILDAALRVFAERGFHGTSVPEVAEAAKVGTGTLYRYFENKEALVNEVYRDAKLRLRSALLDGLGAPTSYRLDDAERWFHQLWQRLGSFAAAEPEAFRFLEMQDHVAYLDAESRQVELSVIGPLFMAGKQMRDRVIVPASGGSKRSRETVAAGVAPMDILFALVWGAFVGLLKAGRLGYITLDAARLAQAGHACWRMIEPGLPRTR